MTVKAVGIKSCGPNLLVTPYSQVYIDFWVEKNIEQKCIPEHISTTPPTAAF